MGRIQVYKQLTFKRVSCCRKKDREKSVVSPPLFCLPTVQVWYASTSPNFIRIKTYFPIPHRAADISVNYLHLRKCVSFMPCIILIFNNWSTFSNKIDCSFVLLSRANHDHYRLNLTKSNILSLLKELFYALNLALNTSQPHLTYEVHTVSTVTFTEPRTQHLTTTPHIRGTHSLLCHFYWTSHSTPHNHTSHTRYTQSPLSPFFPGLTKMHCKHLTWNHRSTPTSVCLLITKKRPPNFY